MILECEACATRYLVDTADIGVLGRIVRCAECGHDWFATTDGVKPSPSASTSIAPEVSPTPSQTADPVAAGPVGAAPVEAADMPQSRNLPAIVPPTDHRPALVIGLGTMLLVLAVLYLVFGRAQIVALWPPAQHAYQVIGLEETQLDAPLSPATEQVEAPEEISAPDDTATPTHLAVPAIGATETHRPMPEQAASPFVLVDVVITRNGKTAQLVGVLKNEGENDSAFPRIEVIEYDANDSEVGRHVHRLNPAYEPLVAGGAQPFTLYHNLADPNAKKLSVSILPPAP